MNRHINASSCVHILNMYTTSNNAGIVITYLQKYLLGQQRLQPPAIVHEQGPRALHAMQQDSKQVTVQGTACVDEWITVLKYSTDN